MCVSQLKIKIFYKYTESVCWWLFCSECSLSQAHFIFCSDPIFCSHSLLPQLLTFSRCMFFSRKLGWHSGFHFRVSCLNRAQKVTQTAEDACTLISSFFFFFVFITFLPLCLFQVANPLMWRKCLKDCAERKKGFDTGWEHAYVFTEDVDGVKQVALASGLKSNWACGTERG